LKERKEKQEIGPRFGTIWLRDTDAEAIRSHVASQAAQHTRQPPS
jgi:hypothetical protein